MRRQFSVLLVVVVVLCGVRGAAQTPTPPRAPVPARQPTPATPAPPVPIAAMPVRSIDLSAGGQPVNIKLEVSVSDKAGPEPVQPKVLTLLLADRSLNSVRAAFEDRSIGIDARPTIVDGKIKLTLTMDSRRAVNPPIPTANWNQNLTVIVENGKSVVVVENSDPSNNRKLSIEVKATIIK